MTYGITSTGDTVLCLRLFAKSFLAMNLRQKLKINTMTKFSNIYHLKKLCETATDSILSITKFAKLTV